MFKFHVPSERIFSSSKAQDTCTAQRGNLSPTTLEALNISSEVYLQDCLNSTEDLVANQRDYDL